MTKYFLAAVGIIFILFGGVDYCIGALMPHDRYLLWGGVAMLVVAIPAWVVAGIRYFRQKSWQRYLYLSLAIALFGATDICAASQYDVLIRPEVTPMMQWNPNAVSGLGAWGCALLFIACFAIAYAILWYFFRGCFQKPQKKEITTP